MADSLLINVLKRFDSSATVEQVIAQLKQEDEEVAKRAFDKEVLKQQWYENCVDKYFLIKNNDHSFFVVHILNKDFWKQDCNGTINNGMVDMYSILFPIERGPKNYSSITHNSGFNKLWLNNPYEYCYDKLDVSVEEIQKPNFVLVANLHKLSMERTFEMCKKIFDC